MHDQLHHLNKAARLQAVIDAHEAANVLRFPPSLDNDDDDFLTTTTTKKMKKKKKKEEEEEEEEEEGGRGGRRRRVRKQIGVNQCGYNRAKKKKKNLR